MTELLEGEIVTDLEPAQSNLALFGTSDPVGVVQEATRIADALADVIRAKGLYTNIQGKSHVRVEGWQLLGSMLGVTAVCTHTEPVDGGYLATVEARTADGRVVGKADALCTSHEKRGPWKSADDYARLSMAQTRATAKALKGPLGFVISLAGYQTTPAEEMTFAEPDTPQQAKPVEQNSNGEAKPIDAEIAKSLDAVIRRDLKLPKGRVARLFGVIGAEAPEDVKAATVQAALTALTAEQGQQMIELLQRETDRRQKDGDGD